MAKELFFPKRFFSKSEKFIRSFSNALNTMIEFERGQLGRRYSGFGGGDAESTLVVAPCDHVGGTVHWGQGSRPCLILSVFFFWGRVLPPEMLLLLQVFFSFEFLNYKNPPPIV